MKQGGVNPAIFKGLSGYTSEAIFGNYSSTYGELMAKGMVDVYKIAVDRGLTDVFIDIGCGVGKCLAWAALCWDSRRSSV